MTGKATADATMRQVVWQAIAMGWDRDRVREEYRGRIVRLRRHRMLLEPAGAAHVERGMLFEP